MKKEILFRENFATKDIHFIFVVDLYNEGCGYSGSEYDSLLTTYRELTVFTPATGTGLRTCRRKRMSHGIRFCWPSACELSVRYKISALVTDVTIPLAQQIEKNTFSLPRGCFISLEKVAQEIVLSHIDRSLSKRKGLIQKIREIFRRIWKAAGITGISLLRTVPHHPQDIYGKSSFRQTLCRGKRCETPSERQDEQILIAAGEGSKISTPYR